MSHIARCARHGWKTPRLRYLQQPSWTSQGDFQLRKVPCKSFTNGGQRLPADEAAGNHKGHFWEEYKRSFCVPRPNFKLSKQISRELIGKEVTAVGSLGKRRDLSSRMTFADIFGEGGSQKVQLFANSDINHDAFKTLRTIPPESAVSVTGVLDLKYEPKAPKQSQENLEQPEEGMVFIDLVEIRLQRIACLNTFPKEFHIKPDAKDRHLQIRFDSALRERLKFRSKVAAFARQELEEFTEVETPILFKSTPEGAREFIVPTRRRGYAYSLPQSPQQYKQLLIASGIHKYIQFAKCFRDEDHRADRQPEFTQIDLEMAWADGEDVMRRVEQLMKALWQKFSASTVVPTFDRIGYHDAMSIYGSDKPDLRIPGLIRRIDHIIPDSLCTMLTSIKNPVVEAWKIRLSRDSNVLRKFIAAFMDSADGAEFRANPDGAPGVFLFNPAGPLEGLGSFGFEAAEQLKALYSDAAALPEAADSQFDGGDVLIVQARRDAPHTGGYTMLGKLRCALFKAATGQGLVQLDPRDRFLWVINFPLFTLNSGDGPGQEGSSGFSATHHPFTAPKSVADVDLLLTDPLSAIADHYDLVINGVELGGGSRRIHNAEMQHFIMRDILKMEPDRMKSFSHLFKALRAGCPPHAGLAIGFDRLIAVMTGQNSVRDVIAFPKDNSAKDLLVNSPSRLSERQLLDYHIQVMKPTELNMEESD